MHAQNLTVEDLVKKILNRTMRLASNGMFAKTVIDILPNVKQSYVTSTYIKVAREALFGTKTSDVIEELSTKLQGLSAEEQFITVWPLLLDFADKYAWYEKSPNVLLFASLFSCEDAAQISAIEKILSDPTLGAKFLKLLRFSVNKPVMHSEDTAAKVEDKDEAKPTETTPPPVKVNDVVTLPPGFASAGEGRFTFGNFDDDLDDEESLRDTPSTATHKPIPIPPPFKSGKPMAAAMSRHVKRGMGMETHEHDSTSWSGWGGVWDVLGVPEFASAPVPMSMTRDDGCEETYEGAKLELGQ